MTSGTGDSTREADPDVEALVVDRYLESLLARRPVGISDVPDDLVTVADRLVADLPRPHPSPTFEEHLAARLAAAAAAAPAGLPTDEPFTLPADVLIFPAARSAHDRGAVRPVVIGGVLTSAAISLAGAAIVAWRWSRYPDDRMARAVRAVARTRPV
jgi:hypothetical protein